MGQEILYCYKCQNRLLGSEFEKGKAFKVGGQASCAKCVKDLLGSVPETAYETDRGRKLQSTSRIPVQASESGSGKFKPATVRAMAPPPAPPVPSKNGVLIGSVVAIVAVLVLLGVAMSGSSSAHRNDPSPAAPAAVPALPSPPLAGPTPPAPTPPPEAGGVAAELRDLDEKLRVALAGEEFKPAAALLENARKRRASPEWLSEIDLRVAQVEGRVRRAALPLREKALEARKKHDDAAVNSLRDRIAAWGFPSVVEDFDRALGAAAAAPSAPPTAEPAPSPAPAVSVPAEPPAPPFIVYDGKLGAGVRNHSWSSVVDFASTLKVYEGSRSISFTATKKWAGFYVHFDQPLPAEQYPYVSFALYLNQDSPLLGMTLWGKDKGKSKVIDFGKLGGLPNVGEWKRYVLPVTPFAADGDLIYSFVLQSGKVSPDPLVYIDAISFLRSAEGKAVPPPLPAPTPAPALGSEKWTTAAQKAAARDYEGAQKDLDDPADLELIKLAAQVPAEAAKLLEKWPKGQRARLDYAGPGGEHLTAEGSVSSADAVRVTLVRDDGPLDLPVSELLPSTLAELFRGRADRKPTDARAAAAFLAFEGDPDGVKKAAGEGAGLPEKLVAFADRHPRMPEAEAAASRLFWSAEGDFAFPKRRAAAVEKYASLQSAPELARLRPYLAGRLEAAKDTLFLAEDLSGAGTFALSGNAKVETFWLSGADTAAGKARENTVEAEFYAFAGAPTKAWVWAGGCCQETFDASWQATELSVTNPKNTKEPLLCEPGSESALSLKISVSLRKWHAQHGGPKEPARWEWVPLALPKYEGSGPKKIRILTSQQGFSVAAILVSATRREPPRDGEMKELEKARASLRKAGGNEPPGMILHEYWLGIDGNNVEDLIKSPVFQGKPSGSSMRDLFEAPRNLADRFGARMRGFIHPPITGAYTFWIASDDGSELFLSSDDSVLKKRSIASCPLAGGIRDWTRAPSCKSAPITLTAGKRYYIEALHKDGGGDDHLAVGWTLPDGTDERPVPGKRLSPWSTLPAAAPPAPAAATTLYRAVALNSPAAIIDGRRWEGKGAPDVFTPEGFENQTVPLIPAVDASKATMIRSSVFAKGSTSVRVERVPAGTYQIYLYIWEDNLAQTMDLFVQGKEVLKGYSSGEAGHWDRLGPWPATVTSGTLEVRSQGGDANFSGLEIYRMGK